MHRIILFFVIVVLIIAGGSYWYAIRKKQVLPIACTMEAKLCPDGSYVGRAGPKCEFAPCPGASPSTDTGTGSILPYDSGINGSVMLGPTCPVERIPPDPNCADKAYQTTVAIARANDPAKIMLTVNSDEGGNFLASLPPGEYILVAGKAMFPRCDHPQVTVASHTFTLTAISCDTGIR